MKNPPAIDPRFVFWFGVLYKAGWSISDIADGYGVPVDSMKRLLS